MNIDEVETVNYDDDHSLDGSSSGAFTETLDGQSEGAFSETQMDYEEDNADTVMQWVNEEGWTLNAPVWPVATDTTNTNGQEMHVNRGSNLTVATSLAEGNYPDTNIVATQIAGDEDAHMDSVVNTTNVGAPVSEVHEDGTMAHRLPRTARFAELQDISDNQEIQSLMNTLEHQLSGGGIINDTRNVDTLVAPDTAGGEITTPQVSRPNSSAQTNSNTAQSISSFPQATTAYGQNRFAPVRGNPGFSRSSTNANSNAPAGRDGGSPNETSSISQSDFMRLIRSVESLSTNVRMLINYPARPTAYINYPARPTANINSAEANMRHPPSSSAPSSVSLPNDEQEEAQPRTLHRRKPVGENRVHNIMRTVLVDNHLRISKRREQMTLKESISKADVEEFVAGRHNGPTLSNLRLDWTEPMTSLWNSTAIYILANHVLERIRSNYYPEVVIEDWMTIDRFFDELKAKLTASREDYENAIAYTAPETDVDAAESRARYAAKKARKKVRNRRNMRRKTLFHCRLGIVQENLGSDPAWENALRLMHVIGDSAMSDDETDIERSTRRKKVVRRVEKPWASAPLKSMVTTLDLYYSRFFHNGNQKPGPGPRDRLTTIVSESPRPTPTALPRNCYSDMYLGSLSPYQRSRLRCKRELIIPTLPLPSL